MAVRVLLIDDDPTWCRLVDLMLSKRGFQVDAVLNARAGLRKAYNTEPDVILLDIMLPDMDGWITCRHLREMSDVPIIMLSALSTAKDVIKGLDMGADGYIVKPVTGEVLAARIRALMRVLSRSVKPGPDPGSCFTYDHIVIDFENRDVTVDGERVNLTPTEFSLLTVLVQHKGKTLPHDFLLREVWGLEHIDDTDYLRLYIRYLRCKLEKDPEAPQLIHSRWGVGYWFG